MSTLSKVTSAIAIATGLIFTNAAHADSRTARIDQIAQIDQRKVELRKIDSAAANATVVFENGARETLDTWDQVIDAIKTDSTVFAYNRPGYGNSDEVTGPRDGRAIVAELRAALRHQGVKPPYILVGHSLGGLYMQLFARTYPQEVKALVLVDSIYPGAVKKTQDFPMYTRLAKRLFFNRALNREIDEINHTGEEILALPAAGRIPVERLVNVPKSAGAIGVDFGAFNGGPELMAKINALYPNARTTVVDSDHRIQVANPEVVVAAIRRVMTAAE